MNEGEPPAHPQRFAAKLNRYSAIAERAGNTGTQQHVIAARIGIALRRTERLGLQAIYAAADLRREGISEEHIGFVLGPRLNALGRLAHAKNGVELLTTDDAARARGVCAAIALARWKCPYAAAALSARS